MTKRFEAFKEEYGALCKKYNVGIFAWHDCSLEVFDTYDCDESYMDLGDRTSETNDKTEET